MKLSHSIGAALVLSAGSLAIAGQPVELEPSEWAGGLSGINNTQLSELDASEFFNYFDSFQIQSSNDQSLLYEANFLTRVVRSAETGELHMNYRILNSNDSLDGQISHVEVTGFEGWMTRVEYRNGSGSAGVQGPIDAMRGATGDMLMFDFGEQLATAEDSRFFFAMTNAMEYENDIATATVYLTSGESASFSVAGVSGVVPAPGALGLLAAGGLLTIRRRR